MVPLAVYEHGISIALDRLPADVAFRRVGVGQLPIESLAEGHQRFRAPFQLLAFGDLRHARLLRSMRVSVSYPRPLARKGHLVTHRLDEKRRAAHARAALQQVRFEASDGLRWPSGACPGPAAHRRQGAD